MEQTLKTRSDVFTELPDVLIQDPVRDKAFLVRSEDLEAFRASAETWSSVEPNTVTFVIPDEDFVEEIPPFHQSADEAPDILVQWPRGKSSFFVPYDELARFEVEPPTQKGVGYGISFVIPRGTELIEELPALRAAILQSGESGVSVG